MTLFWREVDIALGFIPRWGNGELSPGGDHHERFLRHDATPGASSENLADPAPIDTVECVCKSSVDVVKQILVLVEKIPFCKVQSSLHFCPHESMFQARLWLHFEFKANRECKKLGGRKASTVRCCQRYMPSRLRSRRCFRSASGVHRQSQRGNSAVSLPIDSLFEHPTHEDSNFNTRSAHSSPTAAST